MKLLAVCFLLIFCQPHHYRQRPPAPVAETPFCKGVIAAFDKSGSTNKEKFVSAFPTAKQGQARACFE